MSIEIELRDAAKAIRSASALLIGAGAGMGVDSGLPDFRGAEGFWRAYPALQGRSFASVSTPSWFESDPAFAWGFFGHRFQLYQKTVPHDGFQILKRWASSMDQDCFVVTSNVDGHFQKAGFDAEQVLEVHGRIGELQCTAPCCHELFSTDDLVLEIDEANIRCTSQLPRCPHCQEVARPNILMFSDDTWISTATDRQASNYARWLSGVDEESLVIVELGAGMAIRTIRHECESRRGTLIRINPREADGPPGTISLPLPALKALEGIDELL